LVSKESRSVWGGGGGVCCAEGKRGSKKRKTHQVGGGSKPAKQSIKKKGVKIAKKNEGNASKGDIGWGEEETQIKTSVPESKKKKKRGGSAVFGPAQYWGSVLRNNSRKKKTKIIGEKGETKSAGGLQIKKNVQSYLIGLVGKGKGTNCQRESAPGVV